MKTFDENVYQILTAGYERFPSDEVLEAICKLVMKGRPVRKKYCPWYAKAVTEHPHHAPVRVLYRNDGCVVRRGPSSGHPDVFLLQQHTGRPEESADLRQRDQKPRKRPPYIPELPPGDGGFHGKTIQKGRMNREYAALYRTFLKKPEDPDSAKAIANVLFTHHVTCENPKITRVIVCHPAMAGETSYPMTERGAYIRLYGKKARILLEDEQRRRYAVTETCRVEPLFTDEELARACGGFAIENPGLLLHLCGEQEEEMQLTAEKSCLVSADSAHERIFQCLPENSASETAGILSCPSG